MPNRANHSLYGVILCGGSGTRLWPLSRILEPKQFAPLLGDRNSFEATLERAVAIGLSNLVCVTRAESRFLVAAGIEAVGTQAAIVIEPAARNTGPALGLAALHAVASDPNAVLVCLPSDIHISDEGGFAATIASAAAIAATDRWVTLGVTPASPSSAFGYIVPGEPLAAFGGARTVASFVEKPPTETARRLMAAGAMWNSGVFVVSARRLLADLDRHAPAIIEACRKADASVRRDGRFYWLNGDTFASCPGISIDRAVLEKLSDLVVLPFVGEWLDLGSWQGVAALMPRDGQGNALHGNALVADGNNNLVFAGERLVTVLGVNDLVVVDTPDALLVSRPGQGEALRGLVQRLDREGRVEARQHRRQSRPWGTIERLAGGAGHEIRRLSLNPGAAISLQYHRQRSEHWVAVRGTARVTKGTTSFDLRENESTFIPAGELHRLENAGTETIEIVEVQTGEYLGEDDIVRLEDRYGR